MQIDKFRPLPLPDAFYWVKDHADRKGPNIMREALKCYGLKETPGVGNTQDVIDMATYLGGVIEDFYTQDSIPWCGLAVSYWIARANFEPPQNFSQVRARDFATWGTAVDKASFGDILVFWRGSRAGRDGHVGLYVAENEKFYFVLGGNQSDQVNITKISKTRLLTARRCPWKISQPTGVMPFVIAGDYGRESVNEA